MGFLALSLLMLRIFADHHYDAAALDDLAFFAYLFYRRFHFHLKILLFARLSSVGLFGAPCDSALGQVVARNLDRHLIARKNLDEIHS